MRQRSISAAIYAITALGIGGYIDAAHGGNPVTQLPGRIVAATIGVALFAVACVLVLFLRRVGVLLASVAAILSWPAFAVELAAIWSDPSGIVRYQPDTAAAMVTMCVASVYLMTQSRSLLRCCGECDGRNMRLKLLGVLLYAAAVLGFANWRSVWEWLFRLRYGSPIP
jgi:hypothetical protein